MPRFEIKVCDEFCAAHQLRMYDGTLEPLHGHNWRVEVEMTSDKLDGIGAVIDFNVVKADLKSVIGRWHDRFLNELPDFAQRNPTAENVALTLFEALSARLPEAVRMKRVRVWEAVGCSAACVADE